METPITAADLDSLIVEYFDTFEKDKDAAEEVLTQVNIRLQRLESKIVDTLKSLGRKNYQHPRGTVGITPRWRVGMPPDDIAKRQLFEWLREKGIFDKLATVNSASLNALWNAEREAAIALDPTAAIDFNLPGCPAPKLYEQLTKRKGTGK